MCLVILLIGGGVALLAQGIASTSARHTLPARPDDLSVVGAPSLPAATVNAIFARLGSPMAGTGSVVEQASRESNIDDAFALGVWWTETSDGAAGVGLAYRNPGSVRGSVGYPSAAGGYTVYPSYSDAIVYWFHMLRNTYVNRGMTTVYAISHPYVGTTSSPLWAAKVINLMLRYRGEAPPAPTPTLAPSPTFFAQHHPRVVQPFQAGTSGFAIETRAALSSAAPALSPAATWLIVFLALILALAIALWARRLGQPLPSPSLLTPSRETQVSWLPQTGPLHREMPPAFKTPTPIAPILRIPAQPLNTPAWSAAPSTPMARPFSQQVSLPTTAKHGSLRRTLLTPPHQEVEADNTIGAYSAPRAARSTGLLARYGQTPQQ